MARPAAHFIAVLVISAALAASYCVESVPYSVEDGDDHMNITFGELKVVIYTAPWRMDVVDTAANPPRVIISESSQDKHRLGFGKWDGEYFHFYEGYLFRLGLTVEWYYAESMVKKLTDSQTNSVSLLVNTNDPQKRQILVNFTDFQERQFSMHAQVVGSKASDSNRMAIGFETPDSEKFYGFGERFADCNQRGHRVGSWLEDGSFSLGVFDPAKWKLRVPKGEESTYGPMPVMISSKGYGLQMDTFYRTVFDLAKETKGIMMLEQESNTLDIIFFMGTNPRETFSMIVERNGKSLIPPAWEFSPWNQLTTEEENVSGPERIAEFFFKYDIPCSHSIQTVHFFPNGGERGSEDSLKATNEKLLNLGVKNTCYFNAMLDTSYTKLYNEGAGNGYFVKTQDGRPYNFSYVAAGNFYVSQIDFTNPEAVKWYQAQLQRAIDLKFHGWMYDYGEYTPSDSVSYDGTIGLEMHNKFPLLYQKTAFDYLTSASGTVNQSYAPDYVFYVRSSYTGSQRYTWAHWTGDPSSDWSYASGLPAQITASLTIGLTGMPFSGSDIGGFEWYVEPVPDLELWSRWTAAGAVSGLMHEQGGGKGTGKKSHIFDFPNGTAIWRKFAKFRTQLFPYIYTQAHIAHETGMPIMQHHLLNFWNDSKAIDQCQQFMFGDSFLAAPVVDKGAKKWVVYLPTDGSADLRWINVWSNFKYDEHDGRFRIGFDIYYGGGGSVTVDAPIDGLPLFVKAGSIIPVMDPRIQTLNSATNQSVITMKSLEHLRYAWVFADLDFRASGKTWDGITYQLSRNSSVNNTKLLNLMINTSGGVGVSNPVFIVQIAGPWAIEGIPVNVTSPKELLQHVASWEEIVKDDAAPGYSYDGEQRVLWIRLTKEALVDITLK